MRVEREYGWLGVVSDERPASVTASTVPLKEDAQSLLA
jgi:hypothetical protein